MLVAIISTFCFSIVFNSFSFLLISCSNSSISCFLPKIFKVFADIEPPVIAPDELIISPFIVTILNPYEFCFASSIASFIVSTTTVFPSKFKIIPLYCSSVPTRSDAIPITFTPFF